MKQAPAKRQGPANEPDVVETVSLQDAVTHTLDEARMLLPGMQALFGFQLIAVFSPRFDVVLSPMRQCVHLAALLLTGLSIALAMAPAAYHRQAEQGQVSSHLLGVVSGFISAALLPLGLAFCVDLFLVAEVITGHVGWSAGVTAFFGAVLAGLWFAYPRLRRTPRGR
jgi:hypothetical protein